MVHEGRRFVPDTQHVGVWRLELAPVISELGSRRLKVSWGGSIESQARGMNV